MKLIAKNGDLITTCEAVNQFSEGPNQLMANLINKLVELNVLKSYAIEEIFLWEIEAKD